jgi:hypothetical protein
MISRYCGIFLRTRKRFGAKSGERLGELVRRFQCEDKSVRNRFAQRQTVRRKRAIDGSDESNLR